MSSPHPVHPQIVAFTKPPPESHPIPSCPLKTSPALSIPSRVTAPLSTGDKERGGAVTPVTTPLAAVTGERCSTLVAEPRTEEIEDGRLKFLASAQSE
ncbi:hypothetical protein E2C01_075019 [Portunus trituberculatus]|uniref:Uncharacterized protein n=1 Tax=Portunus trituberculatus TaxID=210409 RepID=A0A5B7IF24_PORTR|nr:hypothetical protein [Portunus trituberculatus]